MNPFSTNPHNAYYATVVKQRVAQPATLFIFFLP
nr:MAG TPA: hypothetical protein [Caudoviricetes sp.]